MTQESPEKSAQTPARSAPDRVERGKTLRVGVLKEVYPGERRVAATPATVEKMCKMGLEVVIQAGAGEGASLLDGAYVQAGARIAPSAKEVYQQADLLLKVRAPYVDEAGVSETEQLRDRHTLISFLWPGQNKELLERMAARKVTALAMDMVPRITIAQRMDALSAMANIGGYRAVIEAAHRFGRSLGGQMTAAGRIKPAQVLVVGAGVAGLAAVAAAKSLGAVVRAFDTRPASREQVESLGGEFVEFTFNESGEGEGGYAKQMSEAYLAAEQALLASHCATSDIVITTALIPGVKAPILITSGAVVGMSRGSVIVDLAAEQGGNCALTERDKVIEKFGVTIVGLTDLPSRMAMQASELYAMTVFQLVKEIAIPVPMQNGDGPKMQLRIDHEDEVQRTMLVLEEGRMMWPPPKPQLRAGAPQPPATKDRLAMVKEQSRPASPWPARIGLLLAVVVLVPLGLFAPQKVLQHLTVFLLSCIVGWHVIWNVTPALHTPLMSVTNAISGIILIGGLLLMHGKDFGVAGILCALAVLLASINVAGGFLVTQRMLRMFRR